MALLFDDLQWADEDSIQLIRYLVRTLGHGADLPADHRPLSRVGVDIDACGATGDPARVRQIIRNLLTNAFRYGGPNVSVTGRQAGDRYLLEVSDDGDGITEETLETLFQPFQQSVMGSAVSGSMGLGLKMSRLLAELMDGGLAYDRQNGKAVFRLDLPASTSGVENLGVPREPSTPRSHVGLAC